MNLQRRWVCMAPGVACGVLLLAAVACGPETEPESGVGAPAAALPTPTGLTTVEGPLPTPTPSVTCDVVVDVAESAAPADKVRRAFPQQDGRVFCVEFPKSFVGAPTPTATVSPPRPSPTATPSSPEEAQARAITPVPSVGPIRCDFEVDVAPPGTDPMDMGERIYVLLGGDIYCVVTASNIRREEIPVPDGARIKTAAPPASLMGPKEDLMGTVLPMTLTPEPTQVPTDVWLGRCDALLDALRDGPEKGSDVAVIEELDGARVAKAPDGLEVTESPDGNVHCNR